MKTFFVIVGTLAAASAFFAGLAAVMVWLIQIFATVDSWDLWFKLFITIWVTFIGYIIIADAKAERAEQKRRRRGY